jgi:hypothetical protein
MSRVALALLALAVALPAAAAEIVVLYLGAPDCPYCRHWESQSRPALLASPEAKAIRYVEVHGETLRQPIEARHYPPEYRWVYDQVGPSRGVPRFLLAIDGRVTLSAFGTGGYSRVFLPALKEAVAKRIALRGETP